MSQVTDQTIRDFLWHVNLLPEAWSIKYPQKPTPVTTFLIFKSGHQIATQLGVNACILVWDLKA